ncbi:MAG: hypothetical protein COA52_18370 [Hyphomicrobiales bacterium]|nr:MAG: hypothetical protein COA52_18370 [Hyphomicrobiales bacterium]
MIADQDISLIGNTQAFADNDVLLQACKDVTIAAGADNYSTEGVSAGLSVNPVGPTPSGIGVNFSQNESDSTTVTGADLVANYASFFMIPASNATPNFELDR